MEIYYYIILQVPKWVDSDSIPDNLLFVYGDGDSTRKMQHLNIQLSFYTAPTINQSLVAVNPGLSTWQTIDQNNLNHIGTNSHASIDTFIASKNQESGLCSLDSNSLVSVTNIHDSVPDNILFVYDVGD